MKIKYVSQKEDYGISSSESDSESVTSGSEFEPSCIDSSDDDRRRPLHERPKTLQVKKNLIGSANNGCKTSTTVETSHQSSPSCSNNELLTEPLFEPWEENDDGICNSSCSVNDTSSFKLHCNNASIENSDDEKSKRAEFYDSEYDSGLSNSSNSLSVSEETDKLLEKSLKNPAPNELMKYSMPNKNKASEKNQSNADIITDESINISLDVSINLESTGTAFKNKKNELLVTSEKGTKLYYCLFCLLKRLKGDTRIKVMFAKLVEHYEKARKNESLIKRLNKFDKEKQVKGKTMSRNQIKRKNILNYLRNKANSIGNRIAQSGAEFVVARRPKKGSKSTISNVGSCTKCKQYFANSSLRKHVSKCTGLSFKKRHIVKASSRATIGDYHEIASDESIKIISKMRNDDVADVIRYDYAVFLWLNNAASTYRAAEHHHPKIRSQLSRLSHFLSNMMSLDENVKQLSDVFDEEKQANVIAAIKIMCKPDENGKYLQSPATAEAMYHLLKDAAEIYEIKLGSKNREGRELIVGFLRQWVKLWHAELGNTVAESQAEFRRNKEKKKTSAEDLTCLRKYLEAIMKRHYRNLKIEYSDAVYEALRDSVLSYLHVTNVKRAGEVSRIPMSAFERKQKFGNDYRIEIRGKRIKPVPVVFEETVCQYLELLKENRINAKIHQNNPFMFAKICDVNNDYQPVSACTLMTRFSNLCGAKDPESLRGTFFRKYTATEGMKRGLADHKVEQLAGYLGHTSKIHHQNYREEVLERDICTAKFIKDAQTPNNKISNNNDVSEMTSNSFNGDLKTTNVSNNDSDEAALQDDIEENENLDPRLDIVQGKKYVDISQSVVTASHRKVGWQTPQINIFLAHFPNALDLKTEVPSAASIRNFISKTKDPILQKRTEPQIRSWIHAKRNKKKGKADVPEKNTIPNWIYSAFGKYIRKGKIPSPKSCATIIGSSPSKSNVTVQNIQNWVNLAVRRKNAKDVV